MAFEQAHAAILDDIRQARPEHAASARNLVHYLALRRHDLRDLHAPLAALALSSLGRIEPHVLENLLGVIGHLERACGQRSEEFGGEAPLSLHEARHILDARTEALLGSACGGPGSQPSVSQESPPAHSPPGSIPSGPIAPVHIMVTLPSDAASDPELARALIDAGMTCARINTAHDGPEAWARMCDHVRRAAAAREREGRGSCRILMDLAGPKLRTGPIVPGPEVVRCKPARDPLGWVLRDALVTLRPHDTAVARSGSIPVPRAWLAALEAGDAIELIDTRERRRVLHVERVEEIAGELAAYARSDRTVYIASGTPLRLLKPGSRVRDAAVGRLPAKPQAITVRAGDLLHLSLTERIGRPASADCPVAVLTTTLPEAFARAHVGEPVWIDDGVVGAVIEGISAERIDLRITHASPEGDRILEDKGINLPETDIPVHGITPRDLEVLPIAARCADLVGMSFVRDAADVHELRRRLDEQGGERIGTVLKIETRRAFDNLPNLLLAGLRGPSVGVMIARGDLAVEVGYERLAEVQEEILWLCEAAHLPVIWATQVLETMAKTGRPSRAEVTDAAMGERAECVMLNKGPHIVGAVRFLNGLMNRMQTHQSKKRPILRALNVARRFGEAAGSTRS